MMILSTTITGISMDTPYEFELLNNVWKSGKAPWKIWP